MGRKSKPRSPNTSPKPLPPMQERFVHEYLIDLNATQAAIRAGYAARNADKIGPELLGKTRVAEAIAAAKTARKERVQVDQDYVVTNLVEVVERAMQRAPVCDMRGEQITDANGRGVWKHDGKVAVSALGLLGRHVGMFEEKVKVETAARVALKWVVKRADDGPGSSPPPGTT